MLLCGVGICPSQVIQCSNSARYLVVGSGGHAEVDEATVKGMTKAAREEAQSDFAQVALVRQDGGRTTVVASKMGATPFLESISQHSENGTSVISPQKWHKVLLLQYAAADGTSDNHPTQRATAPKRLSDTACCHKSRTCPPHPQHLYRWHISGKSSTSCADFCASFSPLTFVGLLALSVLEEPNTTNTPKSENPQAEARIHSLPPASTGI